MTNGRQDVFLNRSNRTKLSDQISILYQLKISPGSKFQVKNVCSLAAGLGGQGPRHCCSLPLRKGTENKEFQELREWICFVEDLVVNLEKQRQGPWWGFWGHFVPPSFRQLFRCQEISRKSQGWRTSFWRNNLLGGLLQGTDPLQILLSGMAIRGSKLNPSAVWYIYWGCKGK